MCRCCKGKEAEQNWFLCADPRRAEPQLKKSPGQKWNKALPEKSVLSDEENWNANVFDQTNAISRTILNVWSDHWPHHWGIPSGLWKKLYFPLRSSLSIRYIKTETLMCVLNIFAQMWCFDICWQPGDLVIFLIFLSVWLLKLRSQQNFPNGKVIKSLRPPSAARPIMR